MFSGIVEIMGIVKSLDKEGTNLKIGIQTDILDELHVDQSVSHNGVCLTVEKVLDDKYVLTAVEQTINKSNIGILKIGDKVNLERSLKPDGLLDGHIVQGHVDTTAICKEIKEADGSWYFTFMFKPQKGFLLVEKGSISVNGVSLTVFNVDNQKGEFTVAIIPYTYQVTNFQDFKQGTIVNLEFDVLGKYVMTWIENYGNSIINK